MINPTEVKMFIKGFIKSRGITNIRFIKVHIDGKNPVGIYISLYLDKPIDVAVINDLMNELSKRYSLRGWMIYAPHGKLIRLSGVATA